MRDAVKKRYEYRGSVSGAVRFTQYRLDPSFTRVFIWEEKYIDILKWY